MDGCEKGLGSVMGGLPSRAKMPAPSNAIPVMLIGVCSVSMFLVCVRGDVVDGADISEEQGSTFSHRWRSSSKGNRAVVAKMGPQRRSGNQRANGFRNERAGFKSWTWDGDWPSMSSFAAVKNRQSRWMPACTYRIR